MAVIEAEVIAELPPPGSAGIEQAATMTFGERANIKRHRYGLNQTVRINHGRSTYIQIYTDESSH
jgi:hypothetical protein